MKTKEEIREIESQIYDLLHSVMDPEIELNIVDLGLIYSLVYDGEKTINIKMTFSTRACPLGDAILTNVQQSIKRKFSDFEVNVELVFDPPWNPDMISEEGKRLLGR